MSEFLAGMATASHHRADELRSKVSESELEDRIASAELPRRIRFSDEGFDLIAEPKLASPSEGALLEAGDAGALVEGLATGLAKAGAAVISVLTEPEAFAGNLDHLRRVCAAVPLPVMRKDFLVDPIQILEARAAGASGVLLIARILSRETLEEMTDLALDLRMFALVELFEESDIGTAEHVFDRNVLVGVNSRDLATLGVDGSRHTRMAGLLPQDLPLVAESGVTRPEHAAEVARLGYRMALVGTSLVTSGDPPAAARSLIDSGRSAAKHRALR